MNQRAQIIAKQIACPVAAGLMLAAVVWRQWPLSASTDDIGTLVYALFGLAMVLSPDDVLTYTVGPLFARRPMTGPEASVLDESLVIRVFGFVFLFDALTGWGKWLVWSWS